MARLNVFTSPTLPSTTPELHVATRYEKITRVHLAGRHIVGIFLWSAR